MMALDKRLYGDPLEVLLRQEAETCRGCTHEKRAVTCGTTILLCRLPGKLHGERCGDYEEKLA